MERGGYLEILCVDHESEDGVKEKQDSWKLTSNRSSVVILFQRLMKEMRKHIKPLFIDVHIFEKLV